MNLSALLLAIFLILLGLTWLTWVTISTKFLGGFAAITGVIMLLEATSVFSYTIPAPRRA